MRRIPVAVNFAAISLVAFTLTLAAQPPASAPAQQKAAAKAGVPSMAVSSAPAVVKDLPVRRVVLYKNGVGYFEHAGTVNGNQKVSIDFTSPQLNDVLQSLTVLDSSGGKVGAVGYNSTMPFEQQLKTLGLGLKDYPATTAVYQALRGQRVEVTGAGAPLTGRLVNVEFRKETDKNGTTSDDHYFVIVATDGGALRTAELTDSVSVHMLDASLQKQFANYLEIVASEQDQQMRHLTLEDRGDGQRELRVSYISEVPVWKSTYRIVFPQTPDGKATMQGWAVVDNTVGADWDNVQLSLVAGAPQSFIQPLSQPLYTRRPEIPIATEAQTTPQTHEAAEMKVPAAPLESSEINGTLNNELVDSATLTGRNASEMVKMMPGATFNNGADRNGGVGIGSGRGVGGGVYRPSDSIQEGDVATNAFDDFFEYALTAPVTIHKNQSAMVPILQQELPAQHVTLWGEREPTPLRAVWLHNTSKLTLDSGSFSIFESGEFAGEGLLDPIHPGEKRLLSYAADQAVRVKIPKRDNKRTLHHVQIGKGVIVETHMDVASVTYSAANSADMDRVVLLEHPRQRNGWTLDDGLKADETAPDLYRFRLPVAAHSTATLEVRERGPEYTQVYLNANSNQTDYMLDLVKRVPGALDKLKPVIDAQNALADLDQRIGDSKRAEELAAADEARDRDNLTALKGNDAAKRFVDELNHAEDQLQAARKQTADLELQKQLAQVRLNALIAGISFDWDVK
ncbi:MAG: hypothetical protein ABSG51_10450 [Terracidiphilus sp.]|jgi:hypothetical protein